MDKQIYPAKRSFTAPFWVMLFITLIVTGLYIAIYLSLRRIAERPPTRQSPPFSFFLIIWPALLSVETFVYWLVRKQKLKKVFVWLHITCVIIAFIILPVVVAIIHIILARIYPPAYYYQHVRSVGQVRLYTFWFLFAMGHAFFITTIAKSFSKRKVITEGDEATPGILDGIIDED